MRNVVSKHPFAWSILVIVLFLCSMLIGSILLAFSPQFFFTNGDYLPQLVSESVMSLCGIALVFLFGYGHIWNETKNFGKGLLCGMYMIVYPLIVSLLQLSFVILWPAEMGYGYPLRFEPLWRFIVFTLTMFLIGLAEESFYRGVVANMFWDKHGKDPAGVWTAVIYSGIIFALMHSINFINCIKFDDTVSFDISAAGGVLVQVVSIISMGMAMAAIYYRCRNIWALIFLHGFLDFCGLLTTGLFGGSFMDEVGSYTPVTVLVTTVPYLIVTLVLLRPKKVKEMLAVNNPAIGGIPNGIAYPAVQKKLPSSPKSKRSRNRAVVIAVVLWVVLFAGSIALNDGMRNSIKDMINGTTAVLDINSSGDWNGEEAFGTQYAFEVDETGGYSVSVNSRPSSTNSYVLVQITQGEEIIDEHNYGGICNDEFSVWLEKGEYELNLVYNFSEVTDSQASYNTDVKIKLSRLP